MLRWIKDSSVTFVFVSTDGVWYPRSLVLPAVARVGQGGKGPLKSRGERMSTNCFTICGSTMKSIGTTSTGEKVSTICSTARRLVPHPRPPRHQPPGGGHLPELGRTVHHALLSRPLPSSVSVELSGGSSRQGPLRRLAVHVS